MEEPTTRAAPTKQMVREALSKAGLSKIESGVLSQCKLHPLSVPFSLYLSLFRFLLLTIFPLFRCCIGIDIALDTHATGRVLGSI